MTFNLYKGNMEKKEIAFQPEGTAKAKAQKQPMEGLFETSHAAVWGVSRDGANKADITKSPVLGLFRKAVRGHQRCPNQAGTWKAFV